MTEQLSPVSTDEFRDCRDIFLPSYGADIERLPRALQAEDMECTRKRALDILGGRRVGKIQLEGVDRNFLGKPPRPDPYVVGQEFCGFLGLPCEQSPTIPRSTMRFFVSHAIFLFSSGFVESSGNGRWVVSA
jgi:hypothetical protein